MPSKVNEWTKRSKLFLNRRGEHILSICFWILVLSSIGGYFLYSLEKSGVSDILYLFKNPIYIGVTLIAILFFNFIFSIKDQLRTQKIRNQPSWVYYAFLSVTWSALTANLIMIVMGDYKDQYFLNYFVGNNIFAFTFTVILFLIPKQKLPNNLRFSTGAVGKDDDALGFQASALNAAQSIQRIDKYVSVVALYGGGGYGKSSYARMVIENIEPEKRLYTYISLTETNQAKDFSKLFTERWLEALTERYPKIDTSLVIPSMQTILRENGSSFVASLLSLIPWIDKGLSKTPVKYLDSTYGKDKPRYVSANIAKLFGNVPEFKEELWIIKIDEIERAQFEEIYRIIEIIERFKSEGRSGLPIKVVFLVCISNPDFQKMINQFEKNSQQAYLINYFFENPKSITETLYLPPIDSDLKRDFIVQKIEEGELKEIGEGDTSAYLKEVYFQYPLEIPSYKFIDDKKQQLAYVFGFFLPASPRLVIRSVDGARFFYNAFQRKLGVIEVPKIRLGDILLMEYLKLQYPYLIVFFQKTLQYLLPKYNDGYGFTRGGMSAYFYQQNLTEKKVGLISWIEKEAGVIIPEEKRQEVERLISLVCYSYLDFLNSNRQSFDPFEYEGTLSDPKNLYDYLSTLPDAVTTAFEYFRDMYRQHKVNTLDLGGLSNEELARYSRDLGSYVPSATTQLHLDVLNELAERLTKGDVPLDPSNIGDTPYDDYIYQMTSQITKITEKSTRRDTPTAPEHFEKAYSVFKHILTSEDVNTGAKFIMLNSFANHSRGSGSEIHWKLQDAFKKMLKYWDEEVKRIIEVVFEEYEAKKKDNNFCIYEKEENFFYVMYQGWSGQSNYTQEIAQIRTLAERHLSAHPEALRHYWAAYKYNPEWKDFEDVLEGDLFRDSNSTELYMPLERLIEITKEAKLEDPEILKKLSLWERIVKEEKYKSLTKVPDDATTLRAILLSAGLLRS